MYAHTEFGLYLTACLFSDIVNKVECMWHVAQMAGRWPGRGTLLQQVVSWYVYTQDVQRGQQLCSVHYLPFQLLVCIYEQYCPVYSAVHIYKYTIKPQVTQFVPGGCLNSKKVQLLQQFFPNEILENEIICSHTPQNTQINSKNS